jgi:hypothetical protein
VAPRSGRVAFLAAEEDGTELRRRFQAQAAMMGAPLAGLAGRILVLDRKGVDIHQEGPALVTGTPSGGWAPSRFGRALLADLARRAEDGGPWDLVVVDPLSAFGSTDTELDSAAATATMREVERLCGLPGGPTVLVAHHIKKADRDRKADPWGPPEADDIRGSSGIVNRARWAAVLEGLHLPDDGRRFLRMSVVKGNYSPAGPPLFYTQPQQARGAIQAIEEHERALLPDGKPKKKPVESNDGKQTRTKQNGRVTDGI